MATALTTLCAQCGAKPDREMSEASARLPCPSCGSTRRAHDVSLLLQAGEARVGLTIKAKTRGGKKPHVEVKTGPSLSVALRKPVRLHRVVDRANDRYNEEVSDYESGEILHQSSEPLSAHTGHGSAKRKK